MKTGSYITIDQGEFRYMYTVLNRQFKVDGMLKVQSSGELKSCISGELSLRKIKKMPLWIYSCTLDVIVRRLI